MRANKCLSRYITNIIGIFKHLADWWLGERQIIKCGNFFVLVGLATSWGTICRDDRLASSWLRVLQPGSWLKVTLAKKLERIWANIGTHYVGLLCTFHYLLAFRESGRVMSRTENAEKSCQLPWHLLLLLETDLFNLEALYAADCQRILGVT